MLLRSRSRSQSSGENPPVQKKKKIKPTTISSLPDDLVLNCLARVSRLYYPRLSVVSKKFRSLIASPELYKVRSLLGLTEKFLYVCLKFDPPDSDHHWFTLYPRPNTRRRTKKKNKSILVPIPSPQGHWSGVVSVGSSIYSLGEFVDNSPSSRVSVLDCRFHRWKQAPNMQEGRNSRAASVVDGKIYVVGRPVNYNSSNWIEVFDPVTQIWNFVSIPIPVNEICSSLVIRSTEIDGKICMFGDGKGGIGVAYKPEDGTFESLESEMCKGFVKGFVNYSHCVIDNVLFCYNDCERVFKWFDVKARLWKDLKGLEEMLRIPKRSRVEVAEYGGKMAVLWDNEKVICCAEISLERNYIEEEVEEDDEIWWKVEWLDCVLRVTKSYREMKVISATM